MPHHSARELRLARLYRHHPSRLMIVPLDHSITDGSVVPRGTTMDGLVGQLADASVDAIIVHKGSLRHIEPRRLRAMSVIVHLNASTFQAADPNSKYLVTGVEEALRLGADAVSMHINIGAADEREQIADLGRVANECDRWNVPLLAMMYPRGPKITNPSDPALVAHAVTVAAELGADIVKAPYAGTVAEMADVTAASPIPVVPAGGSRRDTVDGVLSFVRDALAGGAAGVAMGRNVFQSPQPHLVASQVARLVHASDNSNYPPELVEGPYRELEKAVLA
ncbi:MAG TPA: 2-amino-3,7-dideoxy-D-threo-hept-6-ulosonate synthase [Jatrophihabitans sp.]|nr:2-amino-3,7-dideoxy-D-threo-hept-6-ulosonate synthase [Jatrophihabitans sp.]